MSRPAGRTRKRRIAAALLAATAVYSVWLRAEPETARTAVVTVTPATVPERTQGGFTVTGLWRLTARTDAFGGYSAMLLAPDSIRLFSDKGFLLTLPRPGARTQQVRGGITPFGNREIGLRDIESATADPATGRFWVGYEHRHTIARYGADGAALGELYPDYTQGWYANGGLEGIVRLADGRFIALKESGGRGFLYAGDPLAGAPPLPFAVAPPGGFSITDVAQMPDGRVLLVLRRLGLHLPPLETMLAIADPALIDPGTPWRITPLVRIEDLLPRDNYEAVAVEPGAGGRLTVWVASDDNQSALQQNVLARLAFTTPPRIGAGSAE